MRLFYFLFRYGTIARKRHMLLGKFIENWQQTSTQPKTVDEDNHWLKFDDKKSRSRCKLDGCDGFTHAYCTKCDTHFCFTSTRNCFQYHLESVGHPNEHCPVFDSKPSRSRCKLTGCNAFTFIQCVKCNTHLCCSTNRNCFMEHHEWTITMKLFLFYVWFSIFLLTFSIIEK